MNLTIRELQTLRERAARGNLTDDDRRHICENLLDSLLDIAIDWKRADDRITRAIKEGT